MEEGIFGRIKINIYKKSSVNITELLKKEFIEFVDNDSQVLAFSKIYEHKHDFLTFRYIREDGIIAYYYPDFIIKTNDSIYLIETKAENQLNNPNVQRKASSAQSYIHRLNQPPTNFRDGRTWAYVLLGEDRFYTYKNNGGTVKEMLEFAKLGPVKETLF